MAYTSPNVTQLRNKHDLMKDFESEVPMYLANETIVSEINESIDEMNFTKSECKIIDSNFNKKLMLNIYQKMHDKRL